MDFMNIAEFLLPDMNEAYCVKCKAKREMKDAKEVAMNGKGGVQRRAMSGICPTCGTKMFKILGAKK
jgi:Zn finger protein HypA/HybF involved in hydrogenase expression